MAAPNLRIRLLGGLDLRLDDAILPPLESARAESLFTYLLLHREAPQPRPHLAFLLWPDSTEPQAKTNLRHVLHNLRQALPDADTYLEVTPRTLQWRQDAHFWLDIAAFATLASEAERADSDDRLAALREAVELYAGDLLPGCYDEWIMGARDRLRQSYVTMLASLATLLEVRRDDAGAIEFAGRLLRHDPLREETYRLLMRLYDGRGERARALRVYHVCVAMLERELGVEPSAQTQEAYEALLPQERAVAAGAEQGTRLGGFPLVGRAEEWTHLTTLWRATEAGRAQLVLLTGEPGIGKTRLIEAIGDWCGQRGAVVAKARSYPAEGALAYGPIVTWLRVSPLKISLERLDRAHLTELARLLPTLLPAVPDSAAVETQLGTDQRLRLFDAIARAILTAGEPILLVADDLHWCDRETFQFLHYLLRLEPEPRLLVAATARREDLDRLHPLTRLLTGLHALERATEIPLGRLTQAETSLLAEQFTGSAFDEPKAEQLYGETEGNPLFVLEVLRAGWTGDKAERGWITPKVQAVIESRLVGLSAPALHLVGLAATIGREFTVDVLAQASEIDENALVLGLDELWRRRIVREQAGDGYDFSHDQIREVAYRTLSPARRRDFHLRIAAALESVHGLEPGAVAGQIAAHYERAGAVLPASLWYERGAVASQRVHANAEAVRLIDRALTLVATLPESEERGRRELALLAALQAPLAVAEGFASARLALVHQRALALTSELGVEPPPPFLRSLAIASLSRGDFDRAHQIGQQLRGHGEREPDDVLMVESAYVLGVVAFWRGEFGVAREHFAAAIECYRLDHRRAHLLQYGLDPKVICLSRLGNTLWFLGQPVAAVRARDDALALAARVGHPFSQATAIVFAALLALELGDLEHLREYAGLLAERSGERDGKPTQVMAAALSGYLEVIDERTRSGIELIEQALADTLGGEQAPGIRASTVRVLLAAHTVTGDARSGLAAADHALRLGGAGRLWEAEFRRLRAEFLAALGAAEEEVMTELASALAVARRQGAPALELRVLASLLRRQRQRGNDLDIHAAQAALAVCLDRMPAAVDTQDYRSARSLLA